MDRQRILFVNASLQIGGVEKSLCDIISNLDLKKYAVHLYLDEKGDGFFQGIADKVTLVEPNMQGCYGKLLPITKKLLSEGEYSKRLLRITR